MRKQLLWLILLSAALPAGLAMANGFPKQLQGKRLVLKDAQCAGWTFHASGKFADWRNEMECSVDNSIKTRWRVQWLDEDHLLLTETERSRDDLPPRNFVYQVMNIKGKTVTLKEYWTGWGNHAPQVETFLMK
ncbi:hypothetical protein L1281_000363 [Neisseria sp. HSC-16F19]|nr:hypothetical protein [Neisseria sp. HSC-16F19]MCP2039793.1 hypothetical protein [Neisseria sp. HSC-16F19]